MKRILFLILISFQYLFTIAQQSQAPYEFQAKYHMLDSSELFVPHVASKSFTSTTPPIGTVRAIAEWEPAQAVLICVYKDSYGDPVFGIPLELIREMSENTHVITMVESSANQTDVTNLYSSTPGMNMTNCSFIIAPLDSYWARDFGPWFIMTNNSTIAIVDFPYNRPSRPNDDNVPVVMASSANLNEPLYGMNVLHTGGNYMCDGMGVAAMTDLVTDENALTVAQIDTLFKQYMGINHCYITTDPLDDYIKHVDCWGKFLDVDKILIASVPTSSPQYNAYEAMATYWANKVSSYGNNYKVYRVYEPSGQPYTNSLILNKKVLIPMNSGYGSTNNNACMAVYQQAMPGYEILGFQQLSGASWQSTDALHCRAHEIADKGMLYINHYPMLGQKTLQTNYSINANVFALSGSNLVADSAWVRYRVNHGAWVQTTMIHPSGNLWTANIPATPPTGGDTIEYYIHASDQSPRSVTHPLIGSPDPHKFFITTTTSVNTETPDSKILIFPNPAVDYIFLQPQDETTGTISVRLMNCIGEEVKVMHNVGIGDHMLQIPVNDLPCGAYFIQVTKGSSVIIHKVMIMH